MEPQRPALESAPDRRRTSVAADAENVLVVRVGLFDVVPRNDWPLGWPVQCPLCLPVRVRSIVAVRAGKTLDEMVHKVVEDLVDWLVTDYGVTPSMAYTHVSANPDFRINIYQHTVGLAAVGAQLPKKYLDVS